MHFFVLIANFLNVFFYLYLKLLFEVYLVFLIYLRSKVYLKIAHFNQLSKNIKFKVDKFKPKIIFNCALENLDEISF
jgi:hypothetical protein